MKLIAITLLLLIVFAMLNGWGFGSSLSLIYIPIVALARALLEYLHRTEASK